MTFSDGKTLTVKNGSKGSTGATGKAALTYSEGLIEENSGDFRNEPIYVNTSLFNRTPVVGETVLIPVYDKEAPQSYLGVFKVETVSSTRTSLSINDGINTTGIGIQSVEQTTTSTADSGENVVTVTLSTGETSTFKVKNGSQGSAGIKGADGKDGAKGVDGRGISKITDYYAVSTSNTTIPTSFSTTVPTLTSTNKYLWNYQYITYTDGDAYRSAERVIGVYGDTGEVDASKYVTLDGNQHIDGEKYFKQPLSALDGLVIEEAKQEKPIELRFVTQNDSSVSLLVDQDIRTNPEIYLPDASGTIALTSNVEDALTNAIQYTDDEVAAIETALTNYPKLTGSNAFTGNNYFTNGVYVGAPATSTTSSKDGVVNFYGNSATSVLQLTADAASIEGVKNVKLPAENGTLATQTFVNEKVASLVNSAPEALDTLNELAQALGNDANFATTVSAQLGNKVDKVSGKQLSTNDYTTVEKNKLAGITEGANKYVLPTATTNALGGIKSGNDISVDTTGLVTVLDNSHNHTIANVTNLQTTLDAKYSATKPNFGTTAPLMDGTAAVGTATTYSRSDHKHPTDTSRASTAVATTSTNGLMSSTDKAKLDGIATGANNYTLPTASSSTLGGVKTTSTVMSTSGLTACPIISGVPYYKDTTTTYAVATQSANGLMSASDKKKLDNLDLSGGNTIQISYLADTNNILFATDEFGIWTFDGICGDTAKIQLTVSSIEQRSVQVNVTAVCTVFIRITRILNYVTMTLGINNTLYNVLPYNTSTTDTTVGMKFITNESSAELVGIVTKTITT